MLEFRNSDHLITEVMIEISDFFQKRIFGGSRFVLGVNIHVTIVEELFKSAGDAEAG